MKLVTRALATWLQALVLALAGAVFVADAVRSFLA